MFTQCPQCQTVFRVTVAMLKAAQGRVRCGRCSHVFNALTFLIDQPDADVPPGAEPGETPPPDIPEGPNRRASDLPFDPDDYSNQDIPESALEFDLTVDDLNRVFVKAPAPSLQVKPAEPPIPIPTPSDEDTAEHEIIDIEESATVEAMVLEGEDVQVTASLAPATPDDPDIDADNQTSEFSAAMLEPAANDGDSDTDLKREIEKAFANDPTTRAEFVLPSGTRLKFNDGVAEVDSEAATCPGGRSATTQAIDQALGAREWGVGATPRDSAHQFQSRRVGAQPRIRVGDRHHLPRARCDVVASLGSERLRAAAMGRSG